MTPWDPSLLPIPRSWDLEDEERLPPAEKLFVLRTLPFADIRAIGFDMDYTIARYRAPEIDALTFKKALRILVREKGYPIHLLEAQFDPEFAVRGLILDGIRGNLLKLSRERQVLRATHGSRPMDREEIEAVYGHRRLSGSAKGFRSIDTLFEIPECGLYAQLVDVFDAGRLPNVKDYPELFHDVRKAIDTVHRNGEMKAEILEHRHFFILRDPQLAPALDRLKREGKKLFIVTNSELGFTDGVMGHLLNDQDEARPHWTDYFDLVVVQARKPLFFMERPEPEPLAEHPKIFKGGNAHWLEERLDAHGEGILYCGDHVYGDILRSKKGFSWRTLALMPELERELRLLETHAADMRELVKLEAQRRRAQRRASMEQDRWKRNRYHRHLRAHIMSPEGLAALDREAQALAREAETCQQRAHALGEEARALLYAIESEFNPLWGPTFRDGEEQTRFADQLQQYACAYTGRVSNLYMYDPNGTLYAPIPALPHERI